MEKIGCIQLLTTKDIQEYFNCGKNKAQSIMRSRSFPSIKIGRSYFVTVDNLNDWIKKNSYKHINYKN